MKPDFIKRNSPPGMSMKQEICFLLIGLGASFLYSLVFFAQFARARESLYEVIGGKRVLKDGAIMEDFADLIGDTPIDSVFLGFFFVAICMLGYIIYHYAYYRQGSKSIYLMKRLPKRSEIHRRALTLPFLAMLSCIVIAFAVMMIYFAFYMLATPEACLAPNQWQKIWRNVL